MRLHFFYVYGMFLLATGFIVFNIPETTGNGLSSLIQPKYLYWLIDFTHFLTIFRLKGPVGGKFVLKSTFIMNTNINNTLDVNKNKIFIFKNSKLSEPGSRDTFSLGKEIHHVVNRILSCPIISQKFIQKKKWVSWLWNWNLRINNFEFHLIPFPGS